MNFFDFETAAQRYAQARPYFQPDVIEMIRSRLPFQAKVDAALDVACGTGHSTMALLNIANTIVGTDLSNAMIAQATRHPAISFQQAPAERLPFPDASFDLITVCMAYHWFDQPRFLAEAKRLLRPNGTLVVYNSYFPGVMAGNDQYQQAHANYTSQFPTPARSNKHPTQADAGNVGLAGTTEPFEFSVEWNVAQLVDYLCSQSNVIGQVECGNRDLGSIKTELRAQFGDCFNQPLERFLFRGDVSIWQVGE